MTFFRKFPASVRQAWQGDHLLQQIVRNTGYLFTSNTAALFLSTLQGFLAAALLGPAGYGALGLITLFASSVNRLLSFRMGEVVIKYAGQHLALAEKDQAGVVIKAAGLAEVLTSIFAYLVLALLAPLAARWVIKDPQTTPWILVYGIALLANLVTETSTAVLQLGKHFRSLAVLNLLQSALTTALLLLVFLAHQGIYAVLAVYLAGKLIYGLGVTALAGYWSTSLLGPGWWRVPLSSVRQRGEMVRFALSTNLSGTINLVIRDSEVLWVGLFFTSLEAGYYKFALGFMNLLLLPVSPLANTTFPDINQAVARRDWTMLRSLLRRTTLLAGAWLISGALGLLLVGPWLLGWFKGGAYLPSFPAMLILLVGYGFASTFFWNRPLLLAFGQPNYPLKVTALVGAVKTALMLLVVRPLGFLAQAALLSGYFLFSVGWIVRRGLQELRQAEEVEANHRSKQDENRSDYNL